MTAEPVSPLFLSCFVVLVSSSSKSLMTQLRYKHKAVTVLEEGGGVGKL